MYLFESLNQLIQNYLLEEQIKRLRQAYLVARDAHEGQTRSSGEPYITHPVAVACILAEMKLDYETLMAALLHDVIEDTGVKLDHDFFSFLITRDDPSDIPSQQIVSLMRALFQDRVVGATGLRSTAIGDASMLKMSIYEVARSEMTRSTYDRAKNSMDAVGAEIAGMLQQAWGR